MDITDIDELKKIISRESRIFYSFLGILIGIGINISHQLDQIIKLLGGK